MSAIKLKHSSGGGVSIAAPESNPASDRTLYVPSNADGTILTDTTPGTVIQTVVNYRTSSQVDSSGAGISSYIPGPGKLEKGFPLPPQAPQLAG